MNMQKIGQTICELRKRNDMTQLELADKMGVSYQAVSSWERGRTMPDITKLPELSQILHVSLDELLNDEKESALVINVLNNTAETYMETHDVNIADLTEIAPILKPTQVDRLIQKNVSYRIGELAGIAPFVDKQILNELALKAVAQCGIGELVGIAPFIDRKVLNELALQAAASGSIRELVGIAPFIDRHILNNLATQTAESGSIRELAGIAPFVDRQVLDDLALKAANSGSLSELSAIAPFLSKNIISRIVQEMVEQQ